MIKPILVCVIVSSVSLLRADDEPQQQPQQAPAAAPVAAAPPAQSTRLTSQDRWRNYAKEAVLSPAPFFASVMPALGDQRNNKPAEYGQGWDAFGNRLWRRAAHYQMQTAMYHSAAAALKTETGYRRCACSGAPKRLGYALSRSFVTRTDSSRTVPNVAYLGAAFGSAAISMEAMYPSRYRASAEGVRFASTQVGVRTVFNVLQEFGPDLKKLFRRR